MNKTALARPLKPIYQTVLFQVTENNVLFQNVEMATN